MKPHRIGYSKADNLFYVALRATDTEPEKIVATRPLPDPLFLEFDLLED